MLILFVMTGLFLKTNVFQVSYDKYNILQDIENKYYKNYTKQLQYDKNSIKLTKTKVP